MEDEPGKNHLQKRGEVLNLADVGGSAFFVRVSDGASSGTRLVIKL
jgi:hypothetical protein